MTEKRWQVRRGRMLQWSPAWPDSDAELVFDATSGDYWVLSPAAAGLLRRLVEAESTGDSAPAASQHDADPSQDLLAELARHGLVAPRR